MNVVGSSYPGFSFESCPEPREDVARVVDKHRYASFSDKYLDFHLLGLDMLLHSENIEDEEKARKVEALISLLKLGERFHAIYEGLHFQKI
jgi:hypothetical protein